MHSKYKNLLRNKLFWLIVISVLVRLIFATIYPPKRFPETSVYLQLARQFLSGDFTGYTGKNTPIYSFILIAFSDDLKFLAALQQLMGICSAALLFLIFRRLSASSWIGLLAGLSYALNPSQLLFESAYLPETTCTFLISLIVYLTVLIIRPQDISPWWKYAFLGLFSAICLLTRPHYQFLPPLLLVFLIHDLWKKQTPWMGRIAAFLIPVVLLGGIWIGFQYKLTGRARITIQTGLILMHHPINFAEHIPDQYKMLRGVIIAVKDEYIKRKGTYYGAVETSVAAMMDSTGLSYAELDRIYWSACVATIMKKPHLYLASVTRAMARFFKPTWYSRQFGIRGVMAGERLSSKIIAGGYTIVHLGLVAVFCAFSLVILFSKRLRQGEYFNSSTVFIYFTIWTAALIQAMLVLGENSRFRVSVEPLMFGVAVWVAIRLVESFRGSKG